MYWQLGQLLAMRPLDLLRPTSLSIIREHLNV
jgi:hypothetical protein